MGIPETTCHCNDHVVWSEEIYCWAWCDTQTFELVVMQKNLSLWTILYSGCIRFARLWHPVSAVHMQYQLWCTLRPQAKPIHSNLSWCKKFLWGTIFGSRGGFHGNASNNLSLRLSCVVRGDILLSLMWHPGIRTCRDAKKFVLMNNFVVGVYSICKTMTPCQCCVHAMSVVMYLEVSSDTQAFESMQFFFSLKCNLLAFVLVYLRRNRVHTDRPEKYRVVFMSCCLLRFRS